MEEKATIIVHSGDYDKLYSALIIANGALAMGLQQASLFFTFWGLQRLQKNGLGKGALSHLNFFGLGKWLVRRRMRQANVVGLEKLLQDFRALGGKIIACEMTMEIMGIRRQDLRLDLIDDFGAIGTYIQEARTAKINLFI
jgi:peroxiredoxin family protein